MPELKGQRAFYLLAFLFFILGLITVLVDSLIPRLKDVFTLTYFQAGFIQFAFFGAYFLLSIPSSYYLSMVGYQRGTQMSLFMMGLGCLLFIPAANYRLFVLFALACFTLAGGMTLLQVSINPYIAEIGDSQTAAKRLTLAQAFNSLGTTIAPAIGAISILKDSVLTSDEISILANNEQQAYLDLEASAVKLPFFVLALILILLGLIFIRFHLPKLLQEKASGSYLAALKHNRLLVGVFGIFFYVGAEVSLGSYLVNYFTELKVASEISSSKILRGFAEVLLRDKVESYDVKAVVGVFVTLYWGGAMIGRFLGAYIMRFVAPERVLTIFGLGALIMVCISATSTSLIAMFSAIGAGFFNSIMFPTIFSLSLQDLGKLKPKGSGLLCTAIVGGAILPPSFGFLIDWQGFQCALILIMVCYLYISFIGFYFFKTKLLANRS